MALESLGLNFYNPGFEVEIQDKKLAMNISKQILSVEVNEEVDLGSTFTITMNDEFDMNTQEFKWLDNPLFKEGNTVVIKMGYGSDLSPMIIGKITGIEPNFFSGDTTTFTIKGHDLSYEFFKKKKSGEKTFLDKRYSDMAKEIATMAELSAVVDETGKSDPVVYRKDSDMSYFDFLKEIQAKAGCYQFDVDGKKMYFIDPKVDREEILTLELKKDLISFRPTINITELVTEVEVRGHNPKDPKTPIIGRATSGSEKKQEPGKKTGSQIAEENGGKKKVITNIVVTSKDHADAIAKCELNKASNTLIEGEGECIGIPQLRKGVNIKLEKMGKRFSGKYYVKGTTHTINESGYRTRFTVKRNAL